MIWVICICYGCCACSSSCCGKVDNEARQKQAAGTSATSGPSSSPPRSGFSKSGSPSRIVAPPLPPSRPPATCFNDDVEIETEKESDEQSKTSSAASIPTTPNRQRQTSISTQTPPPLSSVVRQRQLLHHLDRGLVPSASPATGASGGDVDTNANKSSNNNRSFGLALSPSAASTQTPGQSAYKAKSRSPSSRCIASNVETNMLPADQPQHHLHLFASAASKAPYFHNSNALVIPRDVDEQHDEDGRNKHPPVSQGQHQISVTTTVNGESKPQVFHYATPAEKTRKKTDSTSVQKVGPVPLHQLLASPVSSASPSRRRRISENNTQLQQPTNLYAFSPTPVQLSTKHINNDVVAQVSKPPTVLLSSASSPTRMVTVVTHELGTPAKLRPQFSPPNRGASREGLMSETGQVPPSSLPPLSQLQQQGEEETKNSFYFAPSNGKTSDDGAVDETVFFPQQLAHPSPSSLHRSLHERVRSFRFENQEQPKFEWQEAEKLDDQDTVDEDDDEDDDDTLSLTPTSPTDRNEDEEDLSYPYHNFNPTPARNHRRDETSRKHAPNVRSGGNLFVDPAMSIVMNTASAVQQLNQHQFRSPSPPQHQPARPGTSRLN